MRTEVGTVIVFDHGTQRQGREDAEKAVVRC